MTVKPRLLDLFCGAGGAAMGYSRAGFVVVGVDINPQPHYPFEFHQGDAMTWPLDGFDVIHASPPCQAYSQAAMSQRNRGKVYPDLLAATRDRLTVQGMPWVIENVPGAPMRPDFSLCGCMFGLELRRRRWFETSWHAFDLMPSCHHTGPVPSVVGHGTPSWVRQQLGYNPTIHHYRRSMGIDWMNRDELSQAIPPAYTEWIGTQLLAHLEAAVVTHMTTCSWCEGAGFVSVDLTPDAATSTQGQIQCPDCDDGLVPWEPDGDAEYEAKVGK